jgi:hypothetical protein
VFLLVYRGRQQARRDAIERGAVAWADAHGGGRFSPEEGRDENGEPIDEVVVVAVRAEVDGREVRILSMRIEPETENSRTWTACDVKLSGPQPTLGLARRAWLRRRDRRLGLAIGDLTSEQLFRVGQGADHADAMLTTESRELLWGLQGRKQVGRAISLLVKDDVLTLSAHPEVANEAAVVALANAATTLAAAIESATEQLTETDQPRTHAER